MLNIARFVAPETFYTEVDDLIEYLKSSPTVLGVDEILTPGEPELRIEAERQKAGDLPAIPHKWNFGMLIPL